MQCSEIYGQNGQKFKVIDFIKYLFLMNELMTPTKQSRNARVVDVFM